MDDRPGDSLTPLTGRLSELLASEEGTLILAELQKLGLLAAEEGARVIDQTPAAPAEGEPLQIGIWDRHVGEDGTVEFVRNAARAEEWRFWADLGRIPAKRGRRVVLLGESVARGYFYDPCVTPASVLETMLESAPGLADVEVLDLAASDLTADEIASLVGALPELEPDAVVLFAGNNWHSVDFDLRDLERLAAAVRRDGYAGCRKVFLEEILVPRCRAAMDAIAERARPLGVPVVVLVPEFNLLDWRSEPSVLAPVLREGGNVPWTAARRRAEQALADGELEEAVRRAAEMIELDGGTSAVSQALGGEASLRLGRVGEARARFEAARDAVCGLLIAHTPRCAAAVQEVLRQKSAEHGFALVDLPRVFEDDLDGGLPDRRLFLDYCHLTLEGMRIAMAATAARLVLHLGGPSMAATDLGAAPIAVDPEDEAVAHFLAAIHNAHYGQGYELLRYHCAKAVETSQTVCEHMLRFLDFQCRRAEQWMCESFDQMCHSQTVRRYLAATDPRVMDKLADFLLIEAVVDVLETAGIEARERVEAILRHDHGRPSQATDLLEDRYRARTFRERKGYSLGLERAYYQALDLCSPFYLILAEACPARFKLACRLPGASEANGEVAVNVNGVRIQLLQAGSAWQTFEFAVPQEVTRAGVNGVELEWPLRAPAWERELERGARSLERGVYPDVLPVFGEVHAFTAWTP